MRPIIWSLFPLHRSNSCCARLFFLFFFPLTYEHGESTAIFFEEQSTNQNGTQLKLSAPVAWACTPPRGDVSCVSSDLAPKWASWQLGWREWKEREVERREIVPRDEPHFDQGDETDRRYSGAWLTASHATYPLPTMPGGHHTLSSSLPKKIKDVIHSITLLSLANLNK